MTRDTEITEHVDRIETIIARLESGDVDLAEAKTLLEEGRDRIDRLEEALDVGTGDVRAHDHD